MAKEKEAKPEKLKEKKAAEKTKRKEEKVKHKESYNPWDVLLYPHLAEKSMNMVELENKLIFMVKKSANKSQIKEAVEKGFEVKVDKVTTEITRMGKKAYVRLKPEYLASDIATRLGMI